MPTVSVICSPATVLLIMLPQDTEYIKIAEEAWKEAIEIAKSDEGWKEEKTDKKTVK